MRALYTDRNWSPDFIVIFGKCVTIHLVCIVDVAICVIEEVVNIACVKVLV